MFCIGLDNFQCIWEPKFERICGDHLTKEFSGIQEKQGKKTYLECELF